MQADIIAESGQRYALTRLLGEGVTSEVYLATTNRGDGDVQVALKVLRPDVEGEIVERFFEEAEILRLLAEGETSLGGEHHVPRLFGVQRQGEKRFLALELASGKPLEELLDPPGSPLPGGERDALLIVAQVARVLHVLHTRLERSYTDMQLRNIYWNDATRQIMIIDWNHVSAKGKGRPLDDLATLGVYCYRLLTGKDARPGEKDGPLKMRAGQQWHNLSLGAQRLCLRLVHPTPERHFASALDVYDAASELLAYWQKEVNDLALEVVGYIGNSDSSEEDVANAEVLLDLLRRKDAPEPVIDNITKRIDQNPKSTVADPLRPGRTFYNAKNYDKAQQRWSQLAETTGDLKHYRWSELARAATLNSAAAARVQPLLDELMGELEKDSQESDPDIEAIQKQFAQIQVVEPQFATANLGLIKAEIDARTLINRRSQRLIAEAEAFELQDDLERAAEKYDEAAQALEEAEALLSAHERVG